MARIQTKKINVNDFSSANKSDIERLGRSLNPFFDEVTKAISNQISYEFFTFDITVDASGVPVSQVSIPTTLSAVKGMICVSATNSTGAVPTAAPFISFNFNKSVIQLNVVKGLPANTKFSLTVLIVS